MTKLMALTCLLMMAATFSVLAEAWKHVPMVDTMCSSKVKGDPDKHTTQCALACATSGFGIIAADGSYLKFDQAGNSKAVALLKAAKQPDRIRVTLTGEHEADTIKVTSLALDK